jgi:PAS domain S-box-containing protein
LERELPGSVDEPAARHASFAELDLATVVEVSHAVSAELELDALIERLLVLAVENAGATRGLLIRPRDGELELEAEARAHEGGVTVRLGPAGAAVAGGPQSILRTVARSHESVLLDDAAAPNRFSSDPHLRAGRVRSILCLPLVKQARLIGLLHLENDLTPHAFTSRRIALLELLASQAAISLENARLHARLRSAEDQVRGALRENRVMVDTIPGQLWRTQPDGSVEYFNRPWLEYAGVTMDEARGSGWTAALHPDDAPRVLAYWRSQLRSGRPGEIEARFRRRDGTYRWFLSRGAPLAGEDGVISCWYGSNTDIEDLKRAESALRRSEHFLHEAQRISQTGSFTWDPRSGELTWSQETYRIYEIDPAVTPTLAMVLARAHPDDAEHTRLLLERAARDGDDWHDERRLLMPDGRVKHVQVIGRAWHDDSGRRGFAGVCKDVTAVRTEEARLQHALAEKEALLKEVHHRVKNNLQLITSLLSLQSDRSDRPVADVLAESRDRVRAMAMVHENLYRTGDLGRVPMAGHITRLCQQLAEAYADGHRVHVRVSSNDLTLDLDRAVTCGLIVNELVSNALKHAFPDGRAGGISVELAPADGGGHVLVVRDDGVGLPAQIDLARVDSLGLQLVHDLAAQLHATVDVSREGGTAFRITFDGDDGAGTP